ncbi:Hypothetical predicted protein [Paramuricea clavata]|uniref:Uncharacterized protein n=1 Tax=Paramuricea clavata TaxID=317549 RepID=A0A7D9LCF9_PARCT|nr:Hypothetical predicted protein [Paramuricea clavata]
MYGRISLPREQLLGPRCSKWIEGQPPWSLTNEWVLPKLGMPKDNHSRPRSAKCLGTTRSESNMGASVVGNVEGADKFKPKRDRNGEVDGKLTSHDDIVFGNDLVDETAAPYDG